MTDGSPNALPESLTPLFQAAALPERRPAKRAPKDRPFCLRLTREERERLEKEAGAMLLGAYIRERLFGEHSAPRRKRRRPSVDQAGLAKVLGMLGASRLAANVNQLAKAAKLGLIVGAAPEVIQQIMEACEDIRTMRNALLAALGLSIEDSP